MYWQVDLSTVAVFGGLTLLEGLRRVPDGAMVLGRTGFSDWRIVDYHSGGGLQLLSWWSPIVITIVLTPSAASQRVGLTAVNAQLAAVASLHGWLRLSGVGLLVCLVLGLPAAVGRSGAMGLVFALAVILTVSLVTALLAFLGMRRMGLSTLDAVRWSLPFLWPFRAPRAAEALIERAAEGLPPAVVAQALLPPASFAAWLRPLVYDLNAQGIQHEATLLLGLDTTLLSVSQASPQLQDPMAVLYCPRCGAGFARGHACPDCFIDLKPSQPVSRSAGGTLHGH